MAQFGILPPTNPISQWVDPRRNALFGFSAGMLAGNPSQAAFGAMQGMQADQVRQDKLAEQAQKTEQYNATKEWLKAKGREDLLPLVDAGQAAFALQQATAQAGRGDATFGLTPIWGTDADGNPVMAQLSNQGGIRPVETNGMTFGKEPIRMDAGTHFVLLDPVTRQQVGIIPKENYQEASDKAAGAVAGKYEAEAPQRQKAASVALSDFGRKQQIVSESIDKAVGSIQANPAVMTGFVGDLTKAIPGTPQYDLAQTLNTIKANVGFDQLQRMRDASPTGGALGQVSEMENRLLQAVNGALEPGQSSQQLVENLARIKQLYAEVLREKQAAYQTDFGNTSATQTAPANDYKTKYGLE